LHKLFENNIIIFLKIAANKKTLMNEILKLNNDKGWKGLAIDNGQVYLMNKHYDTKEEFMKSYAEKGIFKTKKDFSLATVSGMEHAEKNPDSLNINIAGSQERLEMDNADVHKLAAYISAQNNFKPQTEQLSTFKAMSPALGGLVITAIATWLLHTMAADAEAGVEQSYTGRRAGFKKLLASVAETLGTQNTLILGSVAALACIYFLYKAFKKPPNKVVYS
jgi:hypothetical protein